VYSYVFISTSVKIDFADVETVQQKKYDQLEKLRGEHLMLLFNIVSTMISIMNWNFFWDSRKASSLECELCALKRKKNAMHIQQANCSNNVLTCCINDKLKSLADKN